MNTRERKLKIVAGILSVFLAIYSLISNFQLLKFELKGYRAIILAFSIVGSLLAILIGVLLISSDSYKKIGTVLLTSYLLGFVSSSASLIYVLFDADTKMTLGVAMHFVSYGICLIIKTMFALLCINRERIQSKKILWIVSYMLIGASIFDFIITWGFSFGDMFSLANITYSLEGPQYISVFSVLKTVCLSAFVAGTYETTRKRIVTVGMIALYTIALVPFALGFILDIMAGFRYLDISLQYVFLIYGEAFYIMIAFHALMFVIATVLLIARLRMQWIKQEEITE